MCITRGGGEAIIILLEKSESFEIIIKSLSLAYFQITSSDQVSSISATCIKSTEFYKLKWYGKFASIKNLAVMQSEIMYNYFLTKIIKKYYFTIFGNSRP